MNAKIVHPNESDEFETPEGCSILETWNREDDPNVSVARARVPGNSKTQPHSLIGISERYLIVSGFGIVHVEGLEPEAVGPGDLVVIPPGVVQWVENTESTDLIFYCICSPRFKNESYKDCSNE